MGSTREVLRITNDGVPAGCNSVSVNAEEESEGCHTLELSHTHYFPETHPVPYSSQKELISAYPGAGARL